MNMRPEWTIFTLLAAVLCGCASGPEIDWQPRPRAAYTTAELDAWKADPARTNALKSAIAQAEKILEKGLVVPEKEGQWIFYYSCPDDDRRLRPKSETEHECTKCGKIYTDDRTNAAYQTQLYYALDKNMVTLALAYALTGEDRFATPVRDAFLTLARVYPTLTRHDRWGRRGILAIVGGRRYCQHLDEAVGAIKLARAYDLCANSPVFSDKDRKVVEQEFLGRTVREIQTLSILMDSQNNHQTWFNAAYATVGLAIGDESLMRAGLYADGSGLMWQLKKSVTDEGLWYEGTMAYHFYALSAIQDTLEAAARVDWHFQDNERLRSLWTGPLSFTYPDGSWPVINDGDPGSLRSRKAFYTWAADYFQDPSLQQAFEAKEPLASAALRSAGLVALRQGKGDQAVCAFLDYGIHGGHHGHPDKLNITLYALGRELILDPGRISYQVPEYETWARTTVAHNTIVIDAKNQAPDVGQLLWFEETSDYAGCLAVSSGAYPGWELRRMLVLNQNWLVDVMQVTGDKPAQIDLVLHARDQLPGEGTPITTPLGTTHGYDILTNVVKRSADQTRWLFQGKKPTDPVLAVHTWPTADTYTGIGIGMRLTDKVPFLLRRTKAKQTTQVTIYDLTGKATLTHGQITQTDDQITIPITTEQGTKTLHLNTAKGGLQIK